MDISKKILCLLAIFCVIASAGAACAADADFDGGNDAMGYAAGDGGYAGSQYNEGDQGGWAGSQYNETDEGGWAGSQYNETLENAAVGEPVNATTDAAQNITANATSSHTMLATGNPIIALFAVIAVLGGYAVLRKK